MEPSRRSIFSFKHKGMALFPPFNLYRRQPLPRSLLTLLITVLSRAVPYWNQQDSFPLFPAMS
jgi:hypothetical protein